MEATPVVLELTDRLAAVNKLPIVPQSLQVCHTQLALSLHIVVPVVWCSVVTLLCVW
jgi:hypothetical protein